MAGISDHFWTPSNITNDITIKVPPGGMSSYHMHSYYAGEGRVPFTMQQNGHRGHHGQLPRPTNTGDMEWQLVRELQRSGAVARRRAGAVAQWRSGAVWRSLAQFGAVAQWRSGTMLSS